MKSQNNNNKWISELTGENFLAIYDVMLDLREESQLTEDITIPFLRSIVRFAVLMPGDGINMRDRYCNLRWKAAEFLKKKGIIQEIEILNTYHRWESRMRIKVDASEVNGIADLMDKEYIRRSAPKKPEDKSKEIVQSDIKDDPLNVIRKLLERFHAVAIQLRDRHEDRPTLDVSDEYDVQDLLHALLMTYFDDVRPEEWTPSYAGKASRVDFLLKQESIVIEVKKTRVSLGTKEIGDQLILDIARYSKITECKTLVCMVYDPENRIGNPGGFQSDLGGKKENLIVEVIVVPKRY